MLAKEKATHRSQQRRRLALGCLVVAIAAVVSLLAASTGGAVESEEPCALGYEEFAGACWEHSYQSSATALVAEQQCAEAGGTLPSVEGLIAYSAGPGFGSISSTGEWADDVVAFSGKNVYAVAIVNEAGELESALSTKTHNFRCVNPQSP